ncbi:MAG: SpvB/TcaC N-terminal domain-containing protein [Patescibacteria group bacterium]
MTEENKFMIEKKQKIISLVTLLFLVFQPLSFILANNKTTLPPTLAPIDNSSPVDDAPSVPLLKSDPAVASSLPPTSEAPLDLSPAPATDKLTDKKSLSSVQTSSVTSGTTQSYSPSGAQKTLQPKTDLNTGALTFDYPISAPPGRNGLTPDLKLQYNSKNNFNNSMFGYGWTDNIPYIERINKDGTDKLYAENYFYSSTDGELVSQGNGKFTPKTESGSFSSYNFGSDQWLVTDKQGTTYKFGYNSSARQDDPNDTSHIYKWMLEETRDTNDNYIQYTYNKDAGQIYPSAINYSGIFEIEFLRESRVDINKSYATTFLVASNYRISEIQIKINNVWVKKYSLAYTTGDNGVRSLLESVTESGQDVNSVITTLPTIFFDYYKSTPGWKLDTKTYTAPVSFNGYQSMLDVNGDALPDIVESYKWNCNPNQGIVKNTYINNTHNAWSENSSLQPPILFSHCDARGKEYGYGYGWNRGVRTGDVNGDLLPDIIKSDDHTPYILNANEYDTYINTNGSSWVQNKAWLPTITFNGDDDNVDWSSYFIDLNADGLNDIIRNGGGGNERTGTQINIGTSFSTSTQNWNTPVSLATSQDLSVQFVDINSDGLPDILYQFDSSIPSRSEKSIYLNKGDGKWVLDNSFLSDEIYFGNIYQGNRIVFFDVNNDGLVDAVPGSTLVDRNFNTYLNTGTGWVKSPTWNVPGNPWNPWINFTTWPFLNIVDINTDGSLDFFMTQNSTTNAWLNNTKIPTDTLKKITSSTEGNTDITYKKSTQYYDNSNNLLNPNLPLNLTTVSQITINDGNGNSETTSYSYEGGSYFFNTALDRKFAGFNKVSETDSVGNTTTTFYHQGNPSTSSGQTLLGEYNDDEWKIGKPYRVETADSSGNIYSKAINKWDDSDLGNGSKFVKLAQTIDSTYDGDSTHKDKAEGYVYDNLNGNLLQKTEYGEVVGNDNGSFSDIGNDSFTTNYTYAIESAKSKVASQNTVDQNSNKVKESLYYYDNLPLGQLSKGNQTKEEKWKNGNTYVNIQKSYRGYGLVKESVDANGNPTNYAYDNFNLYPATITNALNQTVNLAYDYSTGQVKQKIDPNHRVFQYAYDGLGRLLSEKQPDLVDPSSLVVRTSYIYTDTPNNVATQKTDYLDDSTSIDTYTYFDGLGRKIQEKKEAEDGYSVKDYVYNNRGLLDKESLPYNSSGSARTAPTTTSELYTNYTYDPAQRVTASVNNLGTITNTYNDWKLTITNANGKTKDLSKDAYNNLIQVDEHPSISSGPATTYYSYDYLGDLTKITDALGNIRNFTYDGLGRRLTAQDLHAPGDLTFGAYVYTYDNNGNLIKIVDPNGSRSSPPTAINYTYDVLNRQLTEDYTRNTGVEVTYTYDRGAEGLGRLTGIATRALAQTNTYNAVGELKSESKIINGATYRTSYDYDRLGNQITITNPDSAIVKYNYNSAGLLESVQKKEANDTEYTAVVSNFDYSPTEQPATIVYQNGATTTNTYDSTKLYRLTAKITTLPGSLHLQDLTYTYDAVGNILQIVDASATDTSKTAHYIYDDLDRLMEAVITNVAPGQNAYTQTYTYNAIGNLLTKSDFSGIYIYGGTNYANPHAVTSIGSTPLTYDRNGNELTKGSDLTNTWDYNNRLSQATAGSKTNVYTYDPSGQRIVSANTAYTITASPTSLPIKNPMPAPPIE